MPPYGPYPSRGHDDLPIILILVVLVVIAALALPAILYTMTSGLIQAPGSTPKAIGATITRSADGTNWTVTFASVPPGMSPSTTYLTLVSPSGATLLPDTALSALTGGVVMLSGSAGDVYMRYQGTAPSALSAGDRLLIGTTFAGTTTSTSGCQIQISSSGTILVSSTLQ